MEADGGDDHVEALWRVFLRHGVYARVVAGCAASIGDSHAIARYRVARGEAMQTESDDGTRLASAEALDQVAHGSGASGERPAGAVVSAVLAPFLSLW